MELQKVDSQERGLWQNLIGAITNQGIQVSKVDKLAINIELKKFKTSTGGVNFPALFNIPSNQRLASLAEKNFKETIKILSVALTLCFESMNLIRPMTDSQILDLAETIMDSSGENDKISLEDLMLFLQQFQRGEYGDNYESMDIPKFMSKFNQYRDKRWEAAVEIRTEKELYYKSLGHSERVNQSNPLADSMSDFAAKIGDLKNKLKDRDDELRSLRD